jgi:hypothetical protein
MQSDFRIQTCVFGVQAGLHFELPFSEPWYLQQSIGDPVFDDLFLSLDAVWARCWRDLATVYLLGLMEIAIPDRVAGGGRSLDEVFRRAQEREVRPCCSTCLRRHATCQARRSLPELKKYLARIRVHHPSPARGRFLAIKTMGATRTEQQQDMKIMTETQRAKMAHFNDISTYTTFTDMYNYFDNLAHGPHRTQGALISSHRLGMISAKKGKIFKSTPDAWRYWPSHANV